MCPCIYLTKHFFFTISIQKQNKNNNNQQRLNPTVAHKKLILKLTNSSQEVDILAEFVLYDPTVHIKEFRQMNIETAKWHGEQLVENFQFDAFYMLGKSIEEYVDELLDNFTNLKPPEGILYILEVDGKVAGMGAITNHNGVGELHRMWNRPKYRGKGYGKQMINKLLEAGRKFGCTTFRLSTARFAIAAQHVFRSAGFKEIDEYPETEVAPVMRQYWIYMEKKE